MDNAPENLVIEHLKRIRADIAEVKRDVRDLKASNAMILGMIGELVKASARGMNALLALKQGLNALNTA